MDSKTRQHKKRSDFFQNSPYYPSLHEFDLLRDDLSGLAVLVWVDTGPLQLYEEEEELKDLPDLELSALPSRQRVCLEDTMTPTPGFLFLSAQSELLRFNDCVFLEGLLSGL